jgi:hypothetical protein
MTTAAEVVTTLTAANTERSIEHKQIGGTCKMSIISKFNAKYLENFNINERGLNFGGAPLYRGNSVMVNGRKMSYDAFRTQVMQGRKDARAQWKDGEEDRRNAAQTRKAATKAEIEARTAKNKFAQTIRNQAKEKARKNKEIGAYLISRAASAEMRRPVQDAAQRPARFKPSGSGLQAVRDKTMNGALKFFNKASELKDKLAAWKNKQTANFMASAPRAAKKAGDAAHKAFVKGGVKAGLSLGFGHPDHFKDYANKQNDRHNRRLADLDAKRITSPSGARILYEDCDESLGEVIKSGIRGYQNARMQRQDAYNRGTATRKPGLVGLGQGIADTARAVSGGLKRAGQFAGDKTDTYGNNVRDVSRAAWNKELQDKNARLEKAARIRDYTRELNKKKLELTNPNTYKKQLQRQDIANAKKWAADSKHADKVSAIANGEHQSVIQKVMNKVKNRATPDARHAAKIAKLKRQTELVDAKNNLKSAKAGYIGNSVSANRRRGNVRRGDYIINGSKLRPVPYYGINL